MKYTVIFLAAGLSRRFGENKLLSKLNNKCLYEYGLEAVIDALAKHSNLDKHSVPRTASVKHSTRDRIIVVTRYEEIINHVAAVSTDYPEGFLSCTVNTESEKGISTSIRCGLAQCGPEQCVPKQCGPEQSVPKQCDQQQSANNDSDEAYIFMVADEPNISSDTILDMMNRFESNTCGIMYASYEGISGNPVIFAEKYRDELMALAGDKGGKKVAMAHPEDCTGYEVSKREELEDIDLKISHYRPIASDAYIERGQMIDYFGISRDKADVVCVVGAGGKTTLIDMLSYEISKSHRVIVATTTHMRYPEFKNVYSVDEVIKALPENEQIVVVDGRSALESRLHRAERESENGKITHDKLLAITPEAIDKLRKYNIPILIEADGSHCLPCKAPAVHEPVIPSNADIVIGVQGTVAIGHTIADICHRPDYVAKALNKTLEDTVTEADLIALLTSQNGQMKNVSANMKYYPILNDWKS